MPTITTKDGAAIFYKDWGGRPEVFSHGWPLSADARDPQLNLWRATATGRSPMIAAATAARRRPIPATRWTPMPRI